MIPTMTTPIKRKIRNQKQPLWPCRTTTTCGGGGVVWPIAESLSATVKGRRAAVPFRGGLACHSILADAHPGQCVASAVATRCQVDDVLG
jgi:hypothetical protein